MRLADDLLLFHAADLIEYADIVVGGHRETHPLRSRALRDLLARRYYLEHDRVPTAEAMREALAVLGGRARFEGPERSVAVRVAGDADVIYVDLADQAWRAVEITREGWRLVDAPPVRFLRPASMLPLPEPVRGGHVHDLEQFVRVAGPGDFALLVAWVLAALRPRGPYPVLALHGEPGAAKTTTARILRALVDPNVADVRAEPRELRDLIVAARHGWVIGLDNVSRLPPLLSDALCRLSTGGGWSARQLCTDLEEVLVDVQRPVLLTGIEDLCTRADLVDRAVVVTLPAMPDRERRPERELWPMVHAVRPAVLGALYSAVARGLADLPTVKLEALPRMADFAEWVAACEPAFDWPRGRAVHAYLESRAAGTAVTLEACAVGTALRLFLESQDAWEGTAADLLAALEARMADARVLRDERRWPQSARGLAGTLRRLAPALRAADIIVDFDRGRDRQRTRTIRVATVRTVQHRPTDPSDDVADGWIGNGSATESGSWTVADHADDSPASPDRRFSGTCDAVRPEPVAQPHPPTRSAGRLR